MKSLLLFLLSVIGTAAADKCFDDARFLQAVAIVENSPAGTVGAAGERGAHQLLPVNFHRYSGTEVQRAAQHLDALKAECRRRQIVIIPFNLALMWNAGGPKTADGRAPISSYDYARRVCAVMEALP